MKTANMQISQRLTLAGATAPLVTDHWRPANTVMEGYHA